jgi:predicted ATP-grasp superfamily ATP-dependent carboligase
LPDQVQVGFEVERIEVEIEKLREQLRQNEELISMQESAYREREGSPAVRFKEPSPSML